VDGLTEPWCGSVFVNPPYSNPLPWAKRLAGHDADAPWVALVKCDPTTKWWRTLIAHASSWAPFRHRIAFERPDKPDFVANFPSALVWHLWEPRPELAELLWLARYARAS
ncbi:MAG: phage N-6-adenine-methyltransferase, partial [Myxococcota bacterium]|nr:phage N-6-adenine-methyltransferase [Myxococcota bacterium]